MSTQISQRNPIVSAPPAANDPENERRRQLTITDHLLDEIEDLQLADRTAVPRSVAERLRQVQRELIDGPERSAPRNLRHAHNVVLALQGSLLAANPRYPRPRSHERRALGQPFQDHSAARTPWKLLALPPIPLNGVDPEWTTLAEATVERAFHRWAWAQHHATARPGGKYRALHPIARAMAAWTNCWQLIEDFERITRRTIPWQ
jgi:hypothetical protein